METLRQQVEHVEANGRHRLPPVGRFLLLWAGQLASGLGTGMTGFALGVHVFRGTGSAAAFGLVLAALFVPSIMLRPLGGVLADRLDRRTIIILGDLGSAAAVAFLLLSLASGELSTARICLGVAAGSGFSAMQNPAYKASITDLLAVEHYARAGGLMQLGSALQHLLAPMAAGALLAISGLEVILLLDISTFALAIVAATAMEARRATPARAELQSFGERLRAGAAELRRDREVLTTVLLISMVTFFAGLLQTLFAPMLLAVTDARTLGLVQSISASGMLLTGIFIGAVGIPFTPPRTLLLGLAVAGCALALLGIRAELVWVTAAFFIFFACLPLINTAADVVIRTGIPNEMQGRVWGIVGLLSQLGYVTAYLFGGLLADAIFTPLLLPDGALAETLGRIFGTGPGRGIGLMLSLSGVGLTATAIRQLLRGRRVGLPAPPQGAYQS